MATDPYSMLGLTKGASDADIKKAYRKLAKELHPDRNKDNPKAAERFSKVTQAYDLLSDKGKRAQFDRGEIDGDGNPAFGGFGGGNPFSGGGGNPFGGRGGNPFGGGGAGVDFGDIFEGLFGGKGGGRPGGSGGFGQGGFGQRSAPPQKGGNQAYRLAISFEDAARGIDQRMTLANGTTIDVKLPKGVEEGTQMRLSGKGQAGPGGAGDAIITITIKPHRFFTRDGNHIRLELPITLAEAVRGGPVKVPTVDGAVMLNIPKGATSGNTLRLKEKGFIGKDGKRGDQLVTLMIDIPANDPSLAEFVAGWDDGRAVRGSLE